MKRPALLIGFPFVLGLVLASVSRLWIPVCGGITLAAGAVLLWRRDLWKYVLLGTLSCLTACCVYWQKEAASLGKQIQLVGQETTFIGQVSDMSLYKSGYAKYYLDGVLNESIPARVEIFCDRIDLAFEDTLTIVGTPALLSADYLSDAVGYARAKGVFLSFSMPEISNRISQEQLTLRGIIYRWRMRMTERILSVMGEETGPLLTGMLFGDKSGMSRSSKTALYRTGVGHILAVSGLHLDFLAVCISWLLEKMRLGRKTRFALIAILCGLFVLCAGETISVKRAFIMVLLREGAVLAFRTANSLNSLSIAVFLLGLENPFVIHSVAFWLSCTATWGIGVLAPYMTKEMKAGSFLQKQLRNFVMFCWAFAAILPVSAACFREVSLISPISNTLLVPVCMVSLLLGMLAVLFGGSGFPALVLLSGADFLNAYILEISRSAAKLPWTYAATGSKVLLYLLGAGILMTVGCHIIGKNQKLTVRMVLLALAITGIGVRAEQNIRGNTLRIAVLGSGRDCVLAITAADETVLADMTGSSGGAAYAEAYLTENGIHQVEMLLLCKPSAKSAEKYCEYFTFLPPEQVCLLRSSDAVQELLGGSSQTELHKELLFHGAKISTSPDSVTVEYNGFTFVCTNDGNLPEEEPEVLTIYGKHKEILPSGGIFLILDENSPYQADTHTYVGENNLELTITKDGKCRVRRLYGST